MTLNTGYNRYTTQATAVSRLRMRGMAREAGKLRHCTVQAVELACDVFYYDIIETGEDLNLENRR